MPCAPVPYWCPVAIRLLPLVACGPFDEVQVREFRGQVAEVPVVHLVPFVRQAFGDVSAKLYESLLPLFLFHVLVDHFLYPRGEVDGYLVAEFVFVIVAVASALLRYAVHAVAIILAGDGNLRGEVDGHSSLMAWCVVREIFQVVHFPVCANTLRLVVM